jgi:GNAT superfamily N-acetyltransferase
MEANVRVTQFSPNQPGWQAYTTHLKNCDQARWVLDVDDLPKSDDLIFLGVQDGDAVVANLTLKAQPIVIPATEWAGGVETVLKGPDGEALTETYVQTFHVDEACRRRGIGEQLQRAGLAHTQQLGCYQMRSWSSLNRDANYQLKLKLGFAAHPAVHQADSGLLVSGIYFVMAV